MVRMVCPPINPSAGPGACWSEAVDYSKHWSQSTQLRSSSPSNSTQSLDLRLSGKIQGGPHTRRRSLEDIPTFHARFVRKFCQDYSAWKDGTLCMLHCPGIRLWRVPATRPDPNFFFATRTRPELFFKIFELGLFPLSCVPADCFKSFNNKLQILSFSSRPDMNSSVCKSKCLDRRNGNSEKFDNYFWYIFIYSSWHRGNQTNQSKG